jgi:hypothetical protein
MAPWLTVVTVVRDDLLGLEQTVHSIGGQDLDHVEYLVIDSSTDRGAVPDLLEHIGLAAQYQWTPPEGVYSAMNTGLAKATGAYIYFLNAGDTLHDAQVLGTVRDSLTPSRAPWAYGPVQIISRDGSRTVTPSWNYERERDLAFSRGHFPAHQGTFARTTLLRQVGGFDPAYRIVADYAAFLRISLIADPLELRTVVATFVEGGLSTQRWKASIAEFHRARRTILRPTGALAWRERYETASQFSRQWLVRDILRRGR